MTRSAWVVVATAGLALISTPTAAVMAGASLPAQRAGAALRGPGLLVARADDLVVRAHYPGLWLVSPQGRVISLLSGTWSPVAVAASGAVAAFASAAGADDQLMLVRAGVVSAIPGSASATCVAFSADGAFLSFVTGSTVTLRPPGEREVAFAVDGALWVAPVAAADSPERVASGLFVSGECPAWSPHGHALAYLLRAAGTSSWTVGVYANGGVRTISSFSAPVPTVHWRTFVWSPSSNGLVFLAGDELLQYRNGSLRRLLAPSSVASVSARGTASGASRYARDVSFSPNGRLVAVSVGLATGIYTATGRHVRLVPGKLAGWAGNVGVLVIDKRQTVISLFQYPIGRGHPRRLLDHFKNDVFSDPAGRWYAYPNRLTDGAAPRTYRMLFFRTAGGRLLRRATLPFIPRPLAAIGTDGRIAPPAGGY